MKTKIWVIIITTLLLSLTCLNSFQSIIDNSLDNHITKEFEPDNLVEEEDLNLPSHSGTRAGIANSPWPMFRHDLNQTGRSSYDTSSNPGRLIWNFNTSDMVRSTPVIDSEGTIYVGSCDNKLYAINPNGTQKWNFTTQEQILSAPAIGSDDSIYASSSDGKLYNINTNGSQIWNFSTGGVIESSPVIGPNGTIYIGSTDSTFYAIYPNGTQKWNFSNKAGATSYNFHSSPAISFDGTIYVGSTNRRLYAFNPDGSLKWKFNAIYCIWSSPAIGFDGNIYFGSESDNLHSVYPNGTLRWNFTTGDIISSSPSIGSDGTIYVGSWDGKLYAINHNGTENWNFTTGDWICSSPSIGSDGTIYVGSHDHKLYAIHPDGTEKWNFTTGYYIHSSPTIGYNGTIYVGSSDYNLYAIGTNGMPPIADAGPDQTVYIGEEVHFNGFNSYDPDGIIEIYEWDFDLSNGLWWETGAPPDAFGPDPTHTYDEYGIFIATLRITDNNKSMDTDTCELTVLFPPPLPPMLYINISQDGKNAILYWDPPSIPGIDHYLIYRSTSQTDFDFNNVWINTSANNETGEPGPIPLRTVWNDTNAALPNDENYKEQYYYTIRSVNILGSISSTSRTVGKWTKTFPKGVSTFSLILEPLQNFTIDNYLKDMNARYIKWMDPVNNIWNKHGDSGVNDTQLEVGKGYEVKFDNQTNYTFTGLPGAMIRYDDDSGFLGFDPNSEVKNLTATVDPLTGNVTLNWTQPLGMDGDDSYKVYRSTTRDGFDDGTAVLLDTLIYGDEIYIDSGAASSPSQYYYIVVPVNETGIEGASTYSIGVWTEAYLSGYDTLGIPLRQSYIKTADWYCDNIPDTAGINYLNIKAQRWNWHLTRMPAGAYDPILVMTEGFQISTSNTTKFTFIGV